MLKNRGARICTLTHSGRGGTTGGGANILDETDFLGEKGHVMGGTKKSTRTSG